MSSRFRITALDPDASLLKAIQTHWREYLMEVAELATLMLAVCAAGSLLYSYHSPLEKLKLSAIARSALMGLAIAGATFMIIRSPFGRRSGAHFNPALTLAYFSIRRIHRWDALSYVTAQFIGSVGGVFLARQIFGTNLSDFPVQYVVTLPGRYGTSVAFLAELLMSFVLMGVVLIASNHRRLAEFSPLFVAMTTVTYYTLFASVSSYSVNPARSFSSALFARIWQGLWIYFVAPSLGMVIAAVAYRKIVGSERIYCAKVFHDLQSICPFDCRFRELHTE
jgi:aquaporin Z